MLGRLASAGLIPVKPVTTNEADGESYRRLIFDPCREVTTASPE